MRYALLVLLIFILICSGCVGLTPEDIALANPLVKQFMEQYPNAQIQVTHFTALQSLRMLENMSVDCGKNITAKDLYRITIDDPDSGLNIVAWIDWENKRLECAVKYGIGENKTISKPGEPIKTCKSHAEFRCYGDHVYWFDSCGHKQEKRDYCEQGCELGFCKEKKNCTSHYTYKCYEGHVFWYDSCGNRHEKKQYCEHGCENGECINETINCSSHYQYKCYSGHVYWFDSCGHKEDKKEACEYGCENGYCKPEPSGECEDSDGGKNYYVKGTVTKGTQSLSDHCNEDGTLTEKYCENDEIKSENVNCSERYECSEGRCIEKVEASWYYSDWLYRRKIVINNSVSTPEYYQVKIVFDSSNIDYSKTNDDGSDLRFTYYHAGSEEEVSYWIEKWDEAGESVVWVKAPKIEGIYYVYYGNGGASNESHGENTFEFFDNFDEWDSVEWGTKHDCASLENSILTLTTNNSECGLLSKTIFGVDYSLIIKFKDNVKGIGYQQATWTGWWRSDNLVLAQLHSWSPDEKFWFETKIHPSANSYVTGENTDTDWHVVEIRRNSTNSPAFTLDDKYLWDNSPDKPTHDLGIRLRCLSYAGYSGGASFDYVFVRKYSFPEPSYTIEGIESQEPPGLISTEVENMYTGSIHDTLKEFFTKRYIDVLLTAWISRDDLVGSVRSNFSADLGILVPDDIPMGRIEEGKYSSRYGVVSVLEIVQYFVGFLVSYITSGTELTLLGFQPDVTWDYAIVNATWGDSYPYMIDKRLPTILEGLPNRFLGKAVMMRVACPVDMLVIDPEGKRTGSLYENGEFVGIVNEIERSVYTGRETEPEFVVIFDPVDGEYRIEVYGNETGSYNFSVISVDNGKVFYGKNYTNVSIGEGEIQIYEEPITDIEPPEALIGYDTVSEELVVEGEDNFDKDVGVTYEEECSKRFFGICMEKEREYTLGDDAGNQLILAMGYNKIDHSYRHGSFSFIYARLLKAEYIAGNGFNEVEYERNWLSYRINKKLGETEHFSQNIYMKDKGFIKAFYESKNNVTHVTGRLEGEQRRDVLEGLHVLKIVTDSEEFIKIVS